MKNQSFLRRTNLVLWMTTTVLTGILAGFLCSHSIMLGRYFSWIIESDNYNILIQTFPAFRRETKANVHYNYFLWLSLIIGSAWTVTSFLRGQNRIVALIAGLSSFWVGTVFFASGFAEAEVAVSSGLADETVLRFFLSWNLPLHTGFAIFYTLSFILLLWTGLSLGEKGGHKG